MGELKVIAERCSGNLGPSRRAAGLEDKAGACLDRKIILVGGSRRETWWQVERYEREQEPAVGYLHEGKTKRGGAGQVKTDGV